MANTDKITSEDQMKFLTHMLTSHHASIIDEEVAILLLDDSFGTEEQEAKEIYDKWMDLVIKERRDREPLYIGKDFEGKTVYTLGDRAGIYNEIAIKSVLKGLGRDFDKEVKDQEEAEIGR